jgi:G6PDH family F420-dependent oxidoreductase
VDLAKEDRLAMLPLKLGYKASAEQFDPRTLLEFAVLAEQAGFDSVVVSDHFQPWRHTGGHAPFSFAWLGALGERTSRILMGTSVVTPTFRYHPSIVAQAMATLGVLNPGRVMLGIGTGESMNEVPATGMVWPDFKERYARLREAVTLIRRLWAEDRVTFRFPFTSPPVDRRWPSTSDGSPTASSARVVRGKHSTGINSCPRSSRVRKWLAVTPARSTA